MNIPKGRLNVKELIFATGVAVTIPWVLSLLHETMEMINERANNSFGYRYPSWGDFTIVLYAVPALFVMRVVVSKIFQLIGEMVMSPKYVGKEREERVLRFGVCGFKFMYFVSIVSFGVYTFKNADFLPWVMGGTGDTANCWVNYPYQSIEVPFLKEYYMIQLSYHAHSLIAQISMIHRTDFLEMVLHHLLAIALLAISYVSNAVRIGILVLLVHDVGDIVGYSMKMVVDTPWKILVIINYVALLITWFVTRLAIYPAWVIRSAYVEARQQSIPVHGWLVQNAMLIMLFFLHIYWYSLFLVMGKTFLRTGKAEDIQDKKKHSIKAQ